MFMDWGILKSKFFKIILQGGHVCPMYYVKHY
jgi:hypothetical protein